MQGIYPLTMLFSIITFTLAGVLTPGPNNIMLLSSGLTFGYKRTIPHILGIVLGFTFMVICVGIGVGVVFKMFPFVFTILKYLGISYLLWMAWHIASSKGGIDAKKSSANKPFSFLQAAIFQWVNPKAWVMAITVTATFTTSKEHAFVQVLLISFICLLCGIIATNSWTLGGVYIKKFIKNRLHVRVFNITMATLIVASMLPFIFE
ncbi:MAG: LysE family translocator [Epsilonproteobacteria bacterium]|nr:LysE family translocator [Campylobacterota bacterium]